MIVLMGKSLHPGKLLPIPVKGVSAIGAKHKSSKSFKVSVKEISKHQNVPFSIVDY